MLMIQLNELNLCLKNIKNPNRIVKSLVRPLVKPLVKPLANLKSEKLTECDPLRIK